MLKKYCHKCTMNNSTDKGEVCKEHEFDTRDVVALNFAHWIGEKEKKRYFNMICECNSRLLFYDRYTGNIRCWDCGYYNYKNREV